MSGVAILVVSILLAAAGAVLTIRLAVRVWKNRERASLMAKLAVVLVVAAATFGAFGTLFGIIKALGAVRGEFVEPSQKARILAEGISETMNCGALALVIWLPSIIVGYVLMRGHEKTPLD